MPESTQPTITVFHPNRLTPARTQSSTKRGMIQGSN